ncbi:MAG: hypothetical protein F6K24_27765 [Okeania sp. SIO2D1]|nr:hypothetical protein [Okeania sp. SIO2D1]
MARANYSSFLKKEKGNRKKKEGRMKKERGRRKKEKGKSGWGLKPRPIVNIACEMQGIIPI